MHFGNAYIPKEGLKFSETIKRWDCIGEILMHNKMIG